jgi:peptide/nickel transport system ATP-binding protein
MLVTDRYQQGPVPVEASNETLISVIGLQKYFYVSQGFFRRTASVVKAVDNVSFTLRRGEILGLVGESGCGKTTTARAIVRAIEPTAGKILFHHGDQVVDLMALDADGLHGMRRHMQMIFQDPYSSLNPRMTVKEIIEEPLICYNVGSRVEREERVAELLKVVGLDTRYMLRYPHAFSGGQRQRIGIARALALNPALIIADEPVSALDVSVQAQVLNLMQDLQQQFGLTYLFISHDLGVVEHFCDRVAVMYAGKLVELADTESLFGCPKHPYVEVLLSAVPRPDPSYKLGAATIRGEAVNLSDVQGCAFHPRCRYAEEICSVEEPSLARTGLDKDDHWVACHLAEMLTLKGID